VTDRDLQLRDDLPYQRDPNFAPVSVSERHAAGSNSADLRGYGFGIKGGPSVAHATVPTRSGGCRMGSETAVEVSQDTKAVPTIAGETGESTRGCGISDTRTSRSGHAVESSASLGVCVKTCTRSSTATLQDYSRFPATGLGSRHSFVHEQMPGHLDHDDPLG
jgi:hypothetical protein